MPDKLSFRDMISGNSDELSFRDMITGEKKDKLSFRDMIGAKTTSTIKDPLDKLKSIPKIDLQSKKFPESFIGRQMKGMEDSLGLSKEEFDTLETEIISQENKDSFMESVGEIATLAGQPYDVVKGAGSFILAGIPTFMIGVGGAVSEMNKELPQLIAGYSNLLDMADAAERGFNKVAEYMQPGKEKVEDFLEFPRKSFKGAFGEPLSELLLGRPEDINPELVGELAMVPGTLAQMPFAKAAESDKVKTVANVAKKFWLDKVFITEDNIRGALKFAGFFAFLAGLHRVYKGKPGIVKEPIKRSVIKDVKEVAEKAEKIAETEMLIEKTPDAAIRSAQEKILKMEKVQLELEAKKIAEDIKKEADIEGLIKKDLKDKGKKVEEVKSGLRTAEERQVEIDRAFNVEEKVAIEKKAKSPKVEPKPKVKSKPVEEELTPELKERVRYEGIQNRAVKSPEGKFTEEPAFHTFIDKKNGSTFLVPLKEDINTGVRKRLQKMDEKFEAQPITELDRQTGVSIPKFESEQSPFFQNLEETNTFKKLYDERSKAVSEDIELFTQKLINDVNRDFHGDKTVDIGKVREGLSNLATRADEFRMDFITGVDHLAWKETVSEAAVWARRSEPLRLIKKQREGVELYSGIDPTKIKELIKSIKPKLNKDSQSWKFEVKGMLQEIYKDPESGWWMDGQRLTPGSNRPLYLGDTKVEAVKKSIELTAKSLEGTGVQLYSGFPADKAGKLILEGAKRAKEYMDEARHAKRIRPIRAAKLGYEVAIRELVDKSGNIKWEFIDKLGLKGYEIVQKLVLAKGANTIAANKLHQMQKEVYGGLSRSERSILDNLIMYERLLEISKTKTVKDFNWPIHKKSGKQLTPSDAISYVEMFPYLENLSPKRASVIRNRAKGYFEWMKMPLKDLLKAELISQTEYDDLAARKYRRIKLVDIFDKRYTSKRGKKPLTVYDSGIQELAKGRKTDIYEPSSEIMALEVFNRSYGRIARQKANKALLDLSISDPKNPFVRSKGKDMSVPSGWQRIFAFDKGERKALYISPEMSKEWLTSSSEMPYKYGRFIQYVSGSAVLRTFATGIEWGFALANIPRDIMHIYYAARVFEDGKWTSAYSPHLPIFLPQMGADLARVFPDVVVRGPKTQNYFDYGGGMEFLVHQGLMLRKGKHLEPGLAKPLKVLSWFGETSELATRVAIKERVVRRRAKEQGLTMEEARKNRDIQREATFAARDYMDFGQGGGITKAADNAFPYLNAAVQATRGLWRTAKDNPKEFAYKTAEIGLATTLIYSAMREQCPETAKALQGSMALQNNLCIPVGDNFGFEDEKGQMRYWGFKVPLDPSQRFFKTFFEAAYDKSMGYEVDVDRITNNMFELSPVGVSSMSPTVSGDIGYLYNKDLWKIEDVWSKTKPLSYPKSKEEFIPGRTPEAFKDIGELTGLSPERTKHVAGELFTSNSTWAYLMGKGYEKLFVDVPKEKVEQHWAMTLSRMPITGRFIFVTNPYSKYAGKIGEEEEVFAVKRWVENRELDRLTDGYLFEKAFKREDIAKYIRTFKDVDTRERLQKRYDFQFATRRLPERSFWLRLRSLAPEIRASRYYDRLQSANPKEHERLMKEKAIVIRAGGFFTDNFWEELRKIRREKE